MAQQIEGEGETLLTGALKDWLSQFRLGAIYDGLLLQGFEEGETCKVLNGPPNTSNGIIGDTPTE